MNDARHDELIDHGFGSRSEGVQNPGVIAMGPVQGDIEVLDTGLDDIEIVTHQPTLIGDEVPRADAWEQALLADPDQPPPIAGMPDRGHEVPEADAWEQAQLTYGDDDY